MTLSVLMLFALLVACGDEAAYDDEADYAEDPVQEVDELSEETAVSPAVSGAKDVTQTDALIPADCFVSDDAFWECDDEGLIPDECWDENDELLDACYPQEEVSDDEATDTVALVNGGAPAAGSADSGFRPESDGFGFENYGDEADAINLTAVEMQRMFGEQVCANQTNGCTLTPPARQWMEQMNEGMDGGHCEGMAVLSSLMYYDKIEPDSFGGDITNELVFDNDALQREIAYWWVTQATWPGGYEKSQRLPQRRAGYLDKRLC
ncbi:MAG: hypothetical protein M5U34_30980 [Chloroflexi bacterium]|nr:hypothetical protein [Chloroflexota bacterium]